MILIVINSAAAIFSLAVIGLLVWMYFDENFERQIRYSIQNTNPNPPELFAVRKNFRTAIMISFWIIISLSVVSLVLGLIEIVAAIIQSRAIYVLFIYAMLVLILFETAIGVVIAVCQSKVSLL